MAVYQDGTFPSGTPTLTINSISYICNDFTFPQDATETVNIKNAAGEHAGAISAKGARTGTATLQMAASNTAIPTTSAVNTNTGTFTFTHGSSNVNAFITAATLNKPQAPNPWTVAITFQEKVN
jgi:hypothetical protein